MATNKEHHDHHHHDHDEDCCDHEGCACEVDLLENIDKEEKHSKKPLLIFGIGVIIFLIGYLIENLFTNQIIAQIIFLIGVIYVGHEIIIYGTKSLLKAHSYSWCILIRLWRRRCTSYITVFLS